MPEESWLYQEKRTHNSMYLIKSNHQRNLKQQSYLKIRQKEELNESPRWQTKKLFTVIAPISTHQRKIQIEGKETKQIYLR